MNTTHITTTTGFELDFDTANLDDMETFDLIVKVDRGDVTVLPELLDRLFTAEQKAALYDHCRTETGRVPISAVCAEFAEILQGANPAKK